MTPTYLAGLTLDTGALLALDQPSKAASMQQRLDANRQRGGKVCIPTGVVAQAWRSPQQVRLARLLKSPEIEIAVMTLSVARAIGRICAERGHHDVVDVHVALCARERHHAVVTSDPDDMTCIDPTLPQLAT